MGHIWNILSYMFFYCLLGVIVGVGTVNLILLAGLGILSYSLNWYLLRSLNLSVSELVSIKKRFFVLSWGQFYVNLLITVFLAIVIYTVIYLVLYASYPIDWRYIGGCWVLVFLNTCNIYEVKFRKTKCNEKLLQQLRENTLSNQIHFIREQEDFFVCYTTFTGMKAISRYKATFPDRE